MSNCEKESIHLRNGLEIKKEENEFLLGENKHLYYQNDKLKNVIEREKKKKKMIGGFLGAGIGAAVLVTIISFLVK